MNHLQVHSPHFDLRYQFVIASIYHLWFLKYASIYLYRFGIWCCLFWKIAVGKKYIIFSSATSTFEWFPLCTHTKSLLNYLFHLFIHFFLLIFPFQAGVVVVQTIMTVNKTFSMWFLNCVFSALFVSIKKILLFFVSKNA